jgi:hypothetical protein
MKTRLCPEMTRRIAHRRHRRPVYHGTPAQLIYLAIVIPLGLALALLTMDRKKAAVETIPGSQEGARAVQGR